MSSQRIRIVRALVIPAGLLLIPWVAMQISNDWNWTPLDFVAAYFLLAAAGFVYVVITRNSRTYQHKIVVGLGVCMLLAFVWVAAATGFEGLFKR